MTTTGIGGLIKHVFFPRNLDQLANNLLTIFKLNYKFYIIGGGSNTIFGDKFDERSCLINLSQFNSIKNTCFESIEADTGAILQDIVDIGLTRKLSKFDKLNRIPGSIGGAVYGNAGAYGVEISELINQVTVINLDKFFRLCELQKKSPRFNLQAIIYNSLETYNQNECEFGYRTSLFKTSKHKFLIVKISLKSHKAVNKNKIIELQNSYLHIAKLRDFNYPKNLKSPGSTFKNIEVSNLSQASRSLINPEWIYNNRLPVARLLNDCPSIKTSINGIQMKDGHCNILTNNLHGGKSNASGTSQDVEKYLSDIKSYVAKTYKIQLDEEIRIVSEFETISSILQSN